MQWDNDYDVKEYLPKKKRRPGNDIVLPGTTPASRETSQTGTDGGVLLTTAEMLDFSEGTDSY